MKFDIKKVNEENVGQFIELLSPTCKTKEEALKWCELGKKYHVRTHLANFMWLPDMIEFYKGTGIMVGGGVCFPYGSEAPATKKAAVQNLLDIGVDDIDFSMNYQALNAGKEDMVKEEIQMFADMCKGKVETKLIIEAAMLDSEELIRKACRWAADAGIDWIKTASGLLPKVVSLDHVKIILDELKGTNCKCKVSGIKAPRAQNVYLYLMAGAEAIGTHSVEEVVNALKTERELGLLPPYEG